MYIIRNKRTMVLFRFLFKPLGVSLGIKASRHPRPATNHVLEEEFSLSKSDKSYIVDIDGVSCFVEI